MIAKVLVSIDESAGPGIEAAVTSAAQLASASDAELVVLHVSPPLDPRGLFDAEDEASTAGDGGHVGRVRGLFPHLRARSRTASGYPIETVFHVAEEERPDVIVLTMPPASGGNGTTSTAASDAPPWPSPTAPAGAPDDDATALVGPIAGARRPGSTGPLRSGLSGLRSFYSHRIGWVALLLTSLLLTYGGGAVMFWLHALYRGERGPAISNRAHWALDSTLGFVALTPVLFLILPSALWVLSQRSRPGQRVKLWTYIAAVAGTFTLVTGPGPFLHNVVAGEHTPLAHWAMHFFGHDAEVAMHNMHATEKSPVIEGLLQIGVGLPVYAALTCLALVLVRRIRRGSTRPVDHGPLS
ncbi:MAG: universal stress protein [Actinomycetota bacterium]|nr:universal stress protein [Actinomycetota bacterium]